MSDLDFGGGPGVSPSSGSRPRSSHHPRPGLNRSGLIRRASPHRHPGAGALFFPLAVGIALGALLAGCPADDDNAAEDAAISHDASSLLDAGDCAYPITFTATVTCDLPADEFVSVYIQSFEGLIDRATPVWPLSQIAPGTWQGTVCSPLPIQAPFQMQYRYCRDNEPGAADEAFDEANAQGFRQATLEPGAPPTFEDTVTRWRWWPVDGVVPAVDTTGDATAPPPTLPGPGFLRGVMLPDWWDPRWLPALDLTMHRIADRAHASWVAYPVVVPLAQWDPPVFDPEGPNGTPDDDLIVLLDSARAAGLQVLLAPMAWPTGGPDPSPGAHDAQWWEAFATAWREQLLRLATLAQQHDVSMLKVSLWSNLYNLSADDVSQVNLLTDSLFAEVRSTYDGSLLVEYDPYLPSGTALTAWDEADVLGAVVWDFWPYHLTDSLDPTVAELRTGFGDGMDRDLAPAAATYDKPVLIESFAAYSYDGAASGVQAPEEETNPEYADDPSWKLDLGVQQRCYEAMLQAVAARPFITGLVSFVYTYWNELSKDISVTGKPAEDVLARWYGWMQSNTP